MIHLFSQINRDDLTETEKIILDFFYQKPENILHMSLNEICNTIYVSNASIIRFCQKLGYTGYNDLKFNIRKELNNDEKNADILSIIPRNAYILKDFVEQIDNKAIEKVSQLITDCESIYIYGRDMSSIPANYLYSMLTTMDIPCILIDWLEFLLNLAPNFPKNSLLFLFTNHGYSKDYETILHQCRNRQINIIWISSNEADQALIPLVTYYFFSNEPTLVNTRTNTKINSLLLVQLILDKIVNFK